MTDSSRGPEDRLRERSSQITELWSSGESQDFAEMLIDLEESPVIRVMGARRSGRQSGEAKLHACVVTGRRGLLSSRTWTTLSLYLEERGRTPGGVEETR